MSYGRALTIPPLSPATQRGFFCNQVWPCFLAAGASRGLKPCTSPLCDRKARNPALRPRLSKGSRTRRPRQRQRSQRAPAHYYGSDQAKPVARAAFLATRLTPAPVFLTALFADFMAFAVLDFLRFAIFMPLNSRFVELWLLSSLVPSPFRRNRHDEAA